LGTKKDFKVKNGLIVTDDITLDDGGSLKEAGGTAALTFDGSGHITKIGQDSPSSDDVLTWDGSKAVWSSAGGGGIASLAADDTPQLGGDLDMNGNDIVTTSNADIHINPNGTGSVLVNYASSVNSFAFQVKGNSNSSTAATFTSPTTATNAIQTAAHMTTAITSGTRAAGFGTQLEFRLGEINYGGYVAGKIGAKMKDTGNSNFDMFITPSGTGNLALGNFTLDADQSVGSGQDNYVMTYDHSAGTIGLEAAGGGGASVLGDLTDVKQSGTNFASSLLIQTDSGGSAPTTGTLASANHNIGIGASVFSAIASSLMNVGIGGVALEDLTSGHYNVAIGYGALKEITTVNDNTAVGYFAGGGIGNGANNTAIGSNVLSTANSATQNTGVGASALKATTGNSNTALGYRTLYGNTSGTRNIAIGVQALDSATTEADNIAIGFEALYNPNGGEKNIAIGNYAGDAITSGDENITIGHEAGSALTSANYNNFIGRSAGLLQTTSASTVAIGHLALSGNSVTNSQENTVIGRSAMQTAGGHYSVAIGTNTLFSQASGGDYNTAVGHQTAYNLTTGASNTFIGKGVAHNETTSSHNTAVGKYAMLYARAGTGYNTAVGEFALAGTTNYQTGNYNTAFGADSLKGISSGSKNIGIGYQAADNITTGSNNVMIGGADAASATGSDQLSISSGDGSPVWITGDSNGNVSLNQLADVVAVSGNTTLTQAQSGSYVYWTAGTLTLPADAAVGTQYTIFNNTGGSVTVSLGSGDAMAGSWASNAAIADNDATAYVCVNISSSESQWVQVGA